MVWKSNLEENEQEFIEDFGAKTGMEPQKGGVPPVNQKRPATGKKLAPSAAKSKSSPTKSLGEKLDKQNKTQDMELSVE